MLKTKYNTDKIKLENKTRDTNCLVKKTNRNTKITELENKISDISNLETKTALTTVENKIPKVSNLATKILDNKVGNKIPDISNLATKRGLTAIENKIASISDLVKKTDYNTKITDIENKLNNHDHDKYNGTSDFNILATNIFNARLAQANLITKTDFDSRLSSFNKKNTQSKSKHLLVENNFNKLKTFDPDYFIGRWYSKLFSISTNVQIAKVISNTDYISLWKSKGLSNENFKPPTTSDNSLNPALNYYGTKTRAKFTGSCLKQDKITYTHRKIVNIYIVYEIISYFTDYNRTLEIFLFGAVTLTKNADIDKYGYSGYGIEFDRGGEFSFPGGGLDRNAIIFGVDTSFSAHIDNKKRHISIRNRSNTRIRTYVNCRKTVFD